jgi:hypothetical protein
MSAVYATDEYGRPVIIVREQQKKARMSGTEAIKVCWMHAQYRPSALFVPRRSGSRRPDRD